LGRFDEALAEIRRAQELDPISLIINSNVSGVLYNMGQYDEAIDLLRKTLELDADFAPAHMQLGWVYVRQGKLDEAMAEFQKARTVITSGPFGLQNLGYIYARTGRKSDAAQIINDLLQFSRQGYTVSYDLAIVYSGFGDNDRTLEWIEKAYEERVSWLRFIKTEPGWDYIRSEPRFIALMKKMGLE